jgi:hypothetical protein
VGGEVAQEVRPAELSLGGVEVVVAAPAVGATIPAKRSPSSVLASNACRPAAIRNTAVRLVSAPHRVRLPPQIFQPVSSMLTAAAVLIRCSSSV